MTDSPDDPVDALFHQDPVDFVPRRSALAKSLKAAGDTDAAAAVAKLRKPPRTAAALGEFARSDPGAVQALFDAARAVADSLRTGGADLRAAQSEYSSVVTNLVERAADAGDITSEAMRDRMRSTLLAAGADPDGETARQLAIGAVRDDASAPGFGFGVIGSVAEAPDEGASDGENAAAPPRRRLRSVRTGPGSTGRSNRAASEQADSDDTDAGPVETIDSVETDTDETEQLETALSARERRAAEQAEAEREATARREAMRRRRGIERDVARLERRATRLLEQADEAEAKAAVARLSADEAVAELESVRARLDDLT